ncbi:MAG: type VI secretion system baseplate subunit TssG [Deltaproteobacteria bacterium]|nr:type VI secretion system baseplate subunit TssG [Deltaproteobacteria bacterium]
MAAKDREQTSEIISRLIAKSPSFSFVQASRLLLHQISLNRENDISKKEFLETYIRIRPELSLRFPGTDITLIEKIGDEPLKYLVTATFLGLYGSSSPLPTFYTEDLIEEFNNEKSIKRDFIDIIHYSIYPLFFKIWSKFRLFYKICEEKDENIINKLYCFLGLENKQQRQQIYNIEKYFRYTGLTLQFPRSAEGLEAMISDGFNLKGQINIIQCVKRKVNIPLDQHSFIGVSSCTLGEDLVIGRQVEDISGKFQICISNADADILHSFLPDREFFMELEQMVDFYVNQPLDWELVLELEGKNIETAQPGNKRWSNLGWNTWLVSENYIPDKVETEFSAM